MKRLIFVTGRPGIGKTSVLLRAVNVLKTRGYKVNGMVSREARKGGVRVGFEIADFETGRRGWLAHVNQPTGPQVGKYRVNLEDLKVIGASSILNAVANADVVVVDEIGPMELFSTAFKEAVTQAIRSEKLVLGTIHHRAKDPLITAIRARKDAEILEVTCENRGELHNLIVKRAEECLGVSSGKKSRKTSCQKTVRSIKKFEAKTFIWNMNIEDSESSCRKKFPSLSSGKSYLRIL